MRRSPAVLFATVLIAVLVLDQITKRLVSALLVTPGRSIDLVGGIVKLTYVRNTGAAFGMLPGLSYLFMGVSILILTGIAVFWWRTRPSAPPLVTALALVAAGALGNLIDRIVVGRVTDFLELPFWPVFNVADSAIVFGVIVLVWWILFGERSAQSEVRNA